MNLKCSIEITSSPSPKNISSKVGMLVPYESMPNWLFCLISVSICPNNSGNAATFSLGKTKPNSRPKSLVFSASGTCCCIKFAIPSRLASGFKTMLQKALQKYDKRMNKFCVTSDDSRGRNDFSKITKIHSISKIREI